MSVFLSKSYNLGNRSILIDDFYDLYYIWQNALKSANPLIARPLSESPNCTAHGNELLLFWIKAFPPTLIIYVAHLK